MKVKKGKRQKVEKYIYDDNNEINLVSDEEIIIPFKKGENYEVKIIKPEELQNDLKEKDSFGRVLVLNNNKTIYSKELKSKSNVNKNKSLKEYLKHLFKK